MVATNKIAPVLQFHTVLLYDLLGQSTKLRELRSIPETEEERRRAATLLSDTAGAVLDMRRHMKKFYASVIRSQIEPTTLPQKARELFERSREIHLVVRNFSDLTVAHTPLMEKPRERLPIASVTALMSAAAAMMLLSLATGTPVRGAIDVGLAIDLEGEEIYGPVLESVHHAESKVADWPRILVGDGIVEYLVASENAPGAEMESQIRRGLGKLGLEFVAVDLDGKRIVDYMGTGARNRIGARLPYEVVKKGVEYAEGALEFHRKQRNFKLVARYERVVGYMKSREDLWRVGRT